MRRVRDELALGLPAALLLGDVGEDEHDEIGRRRGHADERDRGAVLPPAPGLGDRGALDEQPLRDAAERQAGVRLRQRRALLERHVREQQPGVLVRELDAQVAVDGEHALVQLLEQPLEPVALRAQLLERLAEARPHAVDRDGELADLVVQARIELAREVALLDRRRGGADALQPPRDQRRRDSPVTAATRTAQIDACTTSCRKIASDGPYVALGA